MTAEPPADDPTDADVTGDESSDTAADAAPDPQTQSGEAPRSDTDSATETDSPVSVPETEPDGKSDDLEARLERLRPPQPSQVELEEPVTPAETLRPAAAQESESRSDDTESGERVGARHDTPPSGAHAADQSDGRERSAEGAVLDKRQPVVTELRTATERTATDSQRHGPAAEETIDAGTADRTRARGSDEVDEDNEEDAEEV